MLQLERQSPPPCEPKVHAEERVREDECRHRSAREADDLVVSHIKIASADDLPPSVMPVERPSFERVL
jgi:hypothetical protein